MLCWGLLLCRKRKEVPDDKELHGSILGNELGIDNKATSTNSAISHQQFFNERDVCVQEGLKKGWQTVRGVKL